MYNNNTSSLPLNHSLAEAVLPAGSKSLKHKLCSAEIYYILSGSGIMHIDEEEKEITKNDTIVIPPHSSQFLENTGKEDIRFLCIVEPGWKPEDEQILE